MKLLRRPIVQFALIMLAIAIFVMIQVTQHRQNRALRREQSQAATRAVETQVAAQVVARLAAANETATTAAAAAVESSASATQAAIQRDLDAARAEQLAAQAALLRADAPDKLQTALLLAAESIRRLPNGQADEVIRYALDIIPSPIAVLSDANSSAAYHAFRSLAFTPDGKFLIAGGSDAAHLWSIPQGKEVFAVPQKSYISDIAVSPDGAHIASVSTEEVLVWSTAGTAVLARFEHSGDVNDIAFSPDGRYLATAGNDETTILWEFDQNTLREAAVIRTATSVLRLAFHPAGKHLLTLTGGGEMGTGRPELQVWEIPSGKLSANWTPAGISVTGALFSPDGRYLAIQGGPAVQVWEFAGRREVARHELTSRGGPGLAFAPDSQSLAFSSEEGIQIWLFTRENSRTVQIPLAGVEQIRFSPDGSLLAGICADQTVRVWRAMNGSQTALISHARKITEVIFSPDGRVIATSSEDATAVIRELAPRPDLYARLSLPGRGSVEGLAISPDGGLVAASRQTGEFTLWSLSPPEQRLLAEGLGGGVNKLIFSPDGKYVAYTGGESLHLFDATTYKEVGPIAYPPGEAHYLRAIAFGPDARYLATVSYDHTARLWDATTGQETRQFILPSGGSSIAFHPDGAALVTGTVTGMVQAWDTGTGQELWQIPSFQSSFGPDVYTSPDGASLVVINKGQAKVYDFDTRQLLFEFQDPSTTPEFYFAAFSPDGRYFAASGNDAIIHVWEVAAKSEVYRLRHEGVARQISFSPDGHYIVSQTLEFARLWDMTTGKEAARIPTQAMKAVISPDNRLVAAGSQVWLWRFDDLLPAICTKVTRNLTPDEWTQYLGSEPYQKTCENVP